MPNIRITVPNTKESVLRPVVLDIVRQLEWLTQIGTKTPITYPDEHETPYQPGSTIDDPEHAQGALHTNSRIAIEVDEDYDPANIYSTAVAQAEHRPIFMDDFIGVTMKPIYSPTNVKINFKYKAKSKTAAMRWRDDIRVRTSSMRDVNLHSVSYHYLIPEQMIDILKEVHKLREAQGGYGEDWANYMAGNSSTRITRIANMSGSQSSLGVAEKQARIVGYFDFEYAPEKGEKEGDEPTWTTTFTYSFRFDKPLEINLKYPTVIHNQVLSLKYRPQSESFDEDQQWRSYSMSAEAFKEFEIQDEHFNKIAGYRKIIAIPKFDEFLPEMQPSGTYGVFSALCQITNENKKELTNLRELVDVNLHPSILKFIDESEWSYMTKPYQSILNISLFRGFHLADSRAITMDQSLNISSVADLNIRVSNRIMMFIVDDISLLSADAIRRLRNYPEVIGLLFAHIGINDVQWEKYVNIIFGNVPYNEFMQMSGVMKTVMNSYIVAYKSSDYKDTKDETLKRENW